MVYVLENDILQSDKIENITTNNNKLFVVVIKFDELKSISDILNINEKLLYDCINGRTSKFESYEGLDYISLKIPLINNVLKQSKKVSMFLQKNVLVFISDGNDIIEEVISKSKTGEIKGLNLSKLLYAFFDKLTFEDTYHIEELEYEIAALEEGLITSKNDNYLKKIIMLRKKLLKLKRYYERLLNIAESIEENDNGLVDKKIIRYFRMFTNRINRLYQNVNNLRDYVTQVREAYQAQVDINQNQLMKLFTVVTTIFLPLTLIVGWYGMNFNMPEYGWSYGYPFVISISISVVVLCGVWFKKNKWL
ncbi:CorA family divalent cation transporter [Clostridium beijerinckii]|jgi:Mg2+ and Co2+ transporters|uniref:Magnesium transport protein CorA n=1 Tax=Clostridium beijerinckii TaxID=1520 RepID=A0A1S8S3S9_CLOBE|nr:CorA family divalent cation transporter [Clostridium beijerinckii]MBC2460331.1 magnesium transporter [Clostridium beijerinckii]MBC2477830.1 magnesium transporter [Clostridium beijerinckii]NOV59381.1 magnesium transporter [Clostridium beijerinckii]NOV72536.1 magnesium transporter [Clostridium beijerinckii]NOW34765.1 magnesium transporter [Clostridium beijerinckii]